MTASSKTMDQKMAAAEAKRKKRMKKKPTTMAGETWHRFKKNKLAYIGMWYLIAMVVIAILAPVIAPYGMDDQNADAILLTPNADHWFGTDNFGRDILSRILYGSRISLMVGFATVVFSMTIGVVLGALAAYYQKLDNVMMRIVDIIYSLPDMLMVVLLSVVLREILNVDAFPFLQKLGTNMISLFLVFALLYWTGMARMVRGQILTIKQNEYVLAARVSGAKSGRIIRKHILPNCISVIIIAAALQIPSAIFTESFLSFIGLGVQAPMPSLGSLANAARAGITEYSYKLIFPAIMICLITLAFNLLGDGLRDAFDPKLRR